MNPLPMLGGRCVESRCLGVDAMSHFHVSVTYLEEEEYDSLLDQRFARLTARKEKDGNYGTALLAIHPDERTRLETGELAERDGRITGTDRYSQN